MSDPKVFVTGPRWLMDQDTGEVAGVLKHDNTVQPWGGDGSFTIANQEEAEAGENNAKGMTPLRTKQAIAAQATGGGGGGLNVGGDSVTQAANSAGKLSTITINGVQWTYIYSGLTPVRREAFGGLLSADIIENGDGYYVEDPGTNIFVHGGAPKVDLATAIVIGDAIVAGTYVAGTHFEPGFRLFVTDLNGGTTLEWSTSAAWWTGINGTEFRVWANTAIEANWYEPGTTAESGGRLTVTLPGKLLSLRGKAKLRFLCEAQGAGTHTVRWYPNGAGATIFGGAYAAGAVRLQGLGVMENIFDRSVQIGSKTVSDDDGSGGSGAGAAYSTTINTVNDVTFELRYVHGTADVAEKMRYLKVELSVEN